MRKNLTYYFGVLGASTIIGVASPYMASNSYAKDHYIDRTRQKIGEIKKKIEEYDKSEKSKENAKNIAGKVLEHVFGIPKARGLIEKIDKESFDKDGNIKKER